jgi:EAL domain-containing protein (putative c-di-GMP-specific phosphodiesterase class I)
VVYVQPKVSSADRSAVGAEALIRYQSKEGSMVLPGNFLPLLEEAQTISQVDFFVFEFICSKVKEWADREKQAFPVSVNFSRFSLAQPSFVEQLVKLCDKYGISPGLLEIEITESIRNAPEIDLKELIGKLRQAGFTVALDDFGTEYVNLSLLSSVEFDVLKLDKTMVDDMVNNPKAQAIIESIAGICKKMGIRVVAEGIETEEQMSVLRTCGVETAQGYLFSRPIPVEEYEEKYL